MSQRSMTLTGDPAGERTIDIPAEGVAAVEARTTRGRRQLVATGRDGRALARVTLEAIPDGGAAALAQRVWERLGGGARG